MVTPETEGDELILCVPFPWAVGLLHGELMLLCFQIKNTWCHVNPVMSYASARAAEARDEGTGQLHNERACQKVSRLGQDWVTQG